MERKIVRWKIHRLMALDWEVVVQHSYREANQCADALANHGCRMDPEICFYNVCPSSFSHLLLFYLLGNTTPHIKVAKYIYKKIIYFNKIVLGLVRSPN